MLYTMKELLTVANEHNFAVPAPNIQNEITAEAVILAAEKANSPLIIDIAYPIHPDVIFLGELTRKLAEASPVPIAINLDHGGSRFSELDLCLKEVMPCIRAGFTSVMVDRSSLSYEENIRQVRFIVQLAHAMHVSVEAELGHVGDGVNYETESDMVLTEPDMALEYIQRTGVDCLAVSVGTAHGMYHGSPHLDFDRLAAIKEKTNHFPLVLHGGSGTGEKNLRKAASMGINKVNIGTDLFRAALNALRTEDLEGNRIYGMWQTIIDSWSGELLRWMDIVGSVGRASLYGTPEKAEFAPIIRDFLA